MNDDLASPLARSLDGVGILVVEDDADARELFSIMLTLYGARVVTSASAVAGLAVLEFERFDLLVSDVHMPEMSGLAFIREVRTSLDARRLPALAITADWDPELQAALLLAGFQRRLAKPFTTVELVVALRLLIEAGES